MSASARRRRAVWASRDAAIASYGSKYPLDVLTDEALHAYVDYGMRDLPDGTVELKCRPEHEATIYTMGVRSTGCHEHLGQVTVPVRIVCGETSTSITPARRTDRGAPRQRHLRDHARSRPLRPPTRPHLDRRCPSCARASIPQEFRVYRRPCQLARCIILRRTRRAFGAPLSSSVSVTVTPSQSRSRMSSRRRAVRSCLSQLPWYLYELNSANRLSHGHAKSRSYHLVGEIHTRKTAAPVRGDRRRESAGASGSRPSYPDFVSAARSCAASPRRPGRPAGTIRRVVPTLGTPDALDVDVVIDRRTAVPRIVRRRAPRASSCTARRAGRGR